MSCEETREKMLDLDADQFEELPHFRDCPDCQRFAERIRAAEEAMGAHVEAFAAGGDFDAQWQAAKDVQRSPRRGWWLVPLLSAAVVLLVVSLDPADPVVPPPEEPEVPVVADPEPEPAVADPEPAAVQKPRSRRPVRPSPRRAAPPAVAPAVPMEVEAPEEPAAAMPEVAEPVLEGLVVVTGLAEGSGIEVACASGYRQRASSSSGQARLSGVPADTCEVKAERASLMVEVRGTVRLVVEAGVLRRE